MNEEANLNGASEHQRSQRTPTEPANTNGASVHQRSQRTPTEPAYTTDPYGWSMIGAAENTQLLSNHRHRLQSSAIVTPTGVHCELKIMRSEAEVREQYEYLKAQLDDEDMRHRGVEELFTHYRRALGWVLEEEHM